MSVPLRMLLDSRRVAVQRGEVRRMWPGAAWDAAVLIWWRGIYWPIRDRGRKPLTPAQMHPGCPLCNPAADDAA